MEQYISYKSGDENFDRTFENALNGIDVSELSDEEKVEHEKWVNDNYEELNQ